MGSWGTGNFDNDDALDLLEHFGATPTKEKILAMLPTHHDAEEARLVTAAAGCQALCAAEIVAASRGRLAPDAPNELRAMNLRWKATDADLAATARVVENLATYSELAELRSQVNRYAEWIEKLDDLRVRLGAGPLPRIRPESAATQPSEPQRSDYAQAVEAMRCGVLEAPLLTYWPEWNEEDALLFERTTLPITASRNAHTHDDEVSAKDVEWLIHGDVVSYMHEERVLRPANVELAKNYRLHDLCGLLWRIYRAAFVTGRPIERRGKRGKRDVLVSPQRFATQLLDVLKVLGGDGNAGILSLVSGRERDENGMFGRALAFAHACGAWSVAVIEKAGEIDASGSAAAAPLLVFARFRMRMRDKWALDVDLDDAEARMPVWKMVARSTLEDVFHRADALESRLRREERGMEVQVVQMPVVAQGLPEWIERMVADLEARTSADASTTPKAKRPSPKKKATAKGKKKVAAKKSAPKKPRRDGSRGRPSGR